MALLEPFVLYFIIFDLWYLQYTQIKGNCCISPQLFLCVFFNYRFLPVLVTHEQNNVDENFDLKIHKMFDFYLLKTKSKVPREVKICQKICPKLSSITLILTVNKVFNVKEKISLTSIISEKFPKVFLGSIF